MKLGYLDILGQIEHTVELVPLADELGYTRYWLTEFPPQPSPITLAAVLAGLTERIRIGTAAVLLTYYPPKRTAHEFQLLERLYEGRIDAGVCSSTAAPALVADDLDGRDQSELTSRYRERFATFVRNLRNTPDEPGYVPELAWVGAPLRPPPIWSLGQGGSAALAAQHGTSFGYPLMYHNSVDDPAVVASYRESFVPYHEGDRPHVVVAVCGLCAETDAAAQAWSRPWKIFVPRIVGSAATCAAALGALRTRYAADEVIFADMCPDLESRKRALELLAVAAADVPALA